MFATHRIEPGCVRDQICTTQRPKVNYVTFDERVVLHRGDAGSPRCSCGGVAGGVRHEQDRGWVGPFIQSNLIKKGFNLKPFWQ